LTKKFAQTRQWGSMAPDSHSDDCHFENIIQSL